MEDPVTELFVFVGTDGVREAMVTMAEATAESGREVAEPLLYTNRTPPAARVAMAEFAQKMADRFGITIRVQRFVLADVQLADPIVPSAPPGQSH